MFCITLCVGTFCVQHKSALITKSLLQLVDKWLTGRTTWRYYSQLAKTCHIMRNYASEVFATTVRKHGPKVANESTRTLIPKCIAGRWGSIFKCQSRVIKIGRDVLSSVLTAVIDGKGQKTQEGVRPRRAASGTAVASGSAAAAIGTKGGSMG